MTRSSAAEPRILTRIVATLGPAVDDDELVGRLIDLGVAVFRLNFSHGDLAAHAARLARVRRVSAARGRAVAVLGDLPGPKIRVGQVAGGGAVVSPGDEIVLARGAFVADPAAPVLRLASTYPALVDELAIGERVLIDDGAVRLLVAHLAPDEVRCHVTVGGRISSGKGINLPESTLSAKPLGERDLSLMAWAVANDLDMLALSFVTEASEIAGLRARIDEEAKRGGASARSGGAFRMPIVAKIERPQAVERIESIVQEADAIMVARGDLGVEMDFAEVPLAQRRLVEVAHAWGKPCIVATQMLQSMIEASSPTRAEASDVATAILGGADGVMLSGETAVGKWPLAAVDAMRRIAAACENWRAAQPGTDAAPKELLRSGYRTAAIAHGVWHIARDNRATCLVVWSQQGGGARYLSRNDFSIPIVAFSSDPRAVRQMALLRGVFPFHMQPPPTIPAWRAEFDPWLIAQGWAARGDRVIVVAGNPLGMAGVTNAVVVHEVGAAVAASEIVAPAR